jgi:tetratricopeptide (TPR) repeat protein
MKMNLKKLVFVLLFLGSPGLWAQTVPYVRGDAGPDPNRLLVDRGIQISTTEAFNLMYNFRFDEAAREFKWLKVEFPEHPIGDFLLGLNEWWRIVPDTKQTRYDESCHAYMDAAIDKAEKWQKKHKGNKEALFFLCASYAIKGRLYAEREKWVKSALAGKKAIKYLDDSRGEENINPELLFGDGVYNYYSKWIHENYKSLRPLLTFFRKGSKEQGIKQLEYVANNAFYSRMEARYFLVQIYAMEKQSNKSLSMAAQMHNMYPNNSFFHRFVARNSFALGRLQDAEVYAKELLENVSAGKYGYGANDGRYGAYILGYLAMHRSRNYAEARTYFEKSIQYALENDSKETGYYASANLYLGKIASEEKKYTEAVKYWGEAMKNSDKKSTTYTEAKKELEALTKSLKKKK